MLILAISGALGLLGGYVSYRVGYVRGRSWAIVEAAKWSGMWVNANIDRLYHNRHAKVPPMPTSRAQKNMLS